MALSSSAAGRKEGEDECFAAGSWADQAADMNK